MSYRLETFGPGTDEGATARFDPGEEEALLGALGRLGSQGPDEEGVLPGAWICWGVEPANGRTV